MGGNGTKPAAEASGVVQDSAIALENKAPPLKYPPDPMSAVQSGAWLDLAVRLAAQIMGGAAAAEIVKAHLASKSSDGNQAARAAARFALATAEALIALAEEKKLILPLAYDDGGEWLWSVHSRGAAMIGAFAAEQEVGGKRYAAMMMQALEEATGRAHVDVPGRVHVPGATLKHQR